jgi:hypothetical protein
MKHHHKSSQKSPEMINGWYKPSKIGWFMALFYPHIPWFAGISLLLCFRNTTASAVHIKPSAVGHGNQAARAVRLRTCPGAREMEVKRGLEWIFGGILGGDFGGHFNGIQ